MQFSWICKQSIHFNGFSDIVIHAMSGDKEKCLAAGMNDYITKPIEVDRLFATLKKWVKLKKPERSRTTVYKAVCKKDTPSKNQFENSETFKTKTPFSDSDDLPGIDIADALERLAGNRQLYFELLRDFHKEYHDVANLVLTLLDKGDIEKALHRIHAIKGVAANLSINHLYQISQTLEMMLGAGEEITPELLKQFEAVVAEVMETLAGLN